jgi:hypothetical protein
LAAERRHLVSGAIVLTSFPAVLFHRLFHRFLVQLCNTPTCAETFNNLMLIYGVGIYSSSISYTLCLFFFASQNHEDLREHISDEYFPFYLLQMCRFIITVEHPTLRK